MIVLLVCSATVPSAAPRGLAFTTSFVRPPQSVRATSTILSASDSKWFSSLPSEPDLLTSQGDFAHALKVVDEDDGRIMNEVSLDKAQIQDAVNSVDNNKIDRENASVAKRTVRASVKETGYDSMHSYMKTMCNHELLNKNEEVVLAREIQLLIKWEEEREKLEEKLLR